MNESLEMLAESLIAAMPCSELRRLPDDDLLTTGGSIERLGRVVDALRATFAGEVGERSVAARGVDGLAARKGCRNPAELIERVTRVSAATARRLLQIGMDTQPRFSLTGQLIPARFPLVAEAMTSGDLGVDAAAAIVKGLEPTLARASIDGLVAAETELVAAAIGAAPETPVACSADEISIQATAWQVVLDPDGVEPSEERRMATRAFTRGTLRDGMIRGHYALLPEIGAKMQRLLDAYTSPKTAPAFLSEEELAAANGARDPRTPDQQRHDVFAAIIDSAARSGDAPSVGGASPTVLITVRAEDMASGRGAGHIDGLDVPVSIRTVRQMTCAGGVQKIILDEYGQVIALGSPERCFTPQQRVAIIRRDGGCVIPGCSIPGSWTEIHHVIPDAVGGPTHISNGCCLCWFHHRTIETSGWQIRMIRGVPHIKPPPWIESNAPWRPSTKSPITLIDRFEKLLSRSVETRLRGAPHLPRFGHAA